MRPIHFKIFDLLLKGCKVVFTLEGWIVTGPNIPLEESLCAEDSTVKLLEIKGYLKPEYTPRRNFYWMVDRVYTGKRLPKRPQSKQPKSIAQSK
jgi:hypothetical protein